MKYKVIDNFYDGERTPEKFRKVGDIVDITKTRAKEIMSKGNFLEELIEEELIEEKDEVEEDGTDDSASTDKGSKKDS